MSKTGELTIETPQVLDFEFDRGMLDQVRTEGISQVRVYPFDHWAVVAGRGSDLKKEVHLDRVLDNNIPIYRRPGGGCSVFLDPGNLIVSLAFPAKGFGDVGIWFERAGDLLIQALKSSGIKGVYRDGISDLVIDNRKIGGSCFYRAQNLAYYSAALLVTPDIERMTAFLAHPPREPGYRKGRAHDRFVAGLDRFTPGITVEELARHLVGALGGIMNHENKTGRQSHPPCPL